MMDLLTKLIDWMSRDPIMMIVIGFASPFVMLSCAASLAKKGSRKLCGWSRTAAKVAIVAGACGLVLAIGWIIVEADRWFSTQPDP